MGREFEPIAAPIASTRSLLEGSPMILLTNPETVTWRDITIAMTS
jgi:hypothetical protein